MQLGTPHKRYRHTLKKKYVHKWRNPPDTQLPSRQKIELKNNAGQVVVTFRNKSVTLHKGYSWNGSNIVGDTKQTLRASAVHDAWCQAMDEMPPIYNQTRENWIKGANEYREICKEDGFGKFRSYVRWIAIRSYAIFKSFQ